MSWWPLLLAGSRLGQRLASGLVPKKQRRALQEEGAAERETCRRGEREASMLTHGGRILVGWFKDEEGASLVEYVLMVALIAVVCIAAVTLLGNAARDKFDFTAKKIGSG